MTIKVATRIVPKIVIRANRYLLDRSSFLLQEAKVARYKITKVKVIRAHLRLSNPRAILRLSLLWCSQRGVSPKETISMSGKVTPASGRYERVVNVA